MADTPKVSIVIPVYRVEKYIETCLETLQNQTLEDLEFIFIDDCGGDSSLETIERYAESDSRIKVIRNPENMGAGRSRNRGIDAATGEYIAFLDPDDWVDKNFYEVLYQRAVEEGCDIVKARRVKATVDEEGAIVYGESKVNDRIKLRLTQQMPLYSCFTSEHQTAIFSRTMVQENHCYNGSSSHSENSVFLMTASHYAKSFSIDGDVAYYYLQREDSSVHTMDAKKFKGELTSFSEQADFACEHLADDPALPRWLHNKIAFLLRRYDELKKIDELKGFKDEFFNTLHKELVKFPKPVLKQLASESGRQINMLIKGDKNKFFFVRDHEGLLSVYSKLSQRTRENADAEILRAVDIADFSSGGLCYLQNHKGSIVASQEFVERYPEFANDYLNSFLKNRSGYNCNLSSSPELLAEHKELAKTEELCWRYVKRFGSISKTTIYCDEDGDLAMRGEILGSNDVIDSERFRVHPQENRKIIDGIVLNQYLSELGRGGVISELYRYLLFLFERFENVDGTLDGMVYDAFPFNCLLTTGHRYVLFDLEFEFKHPVDKGYMTYKCANVLGEGRKKAVYFELCELLGLVPMWRHWDDFNFRNWFSTLSEPDDVPSNAENVELFRRYFLQGKAK